jgi:hypothetical protein
MYFKENETVKDSLRKLENHLDEKEIIETLNSKLKNNNKLTL